MNNDNTIEKRAGFTQGPWIVKPGKNYYHIHGAQEVALVENWMNETPKANAHLIASAPALHEALQNLLTEFDAYEEAMCRRFGAGHEDYGRQRELARLALAKADGGEA